MRSAGWLAAYVRRISGNTWNLGLEDESSGAAQHSIACLRGLHSISVYQYTAYCTSKKKIVLKVKYLNK